MVLDVAYLNSFYFLVAYKGTFMTLLRCSGFFALFHALAALLPESAVFFINVANVCKVLWIYSYLSLLMTNFNPMGHGGMRENVDKAGEILEAAQLPELKNPIFCTPCTCSTTIKPNTSWISSCIYRVKFFLACEILFVILTQVLEDQNLLLNDDGTPKLAERLMRLADVLILLFGVSGFMSLRRFLLPLVQPGKREDVVVRAVLCTVFFTWIGGIQNLFLSLCNFHQNTNYAVINVEMLIFQVFCHRYYVPTFVWGFSPPKFHEDNVSQQLSDYKFLIPIEDMATVLCQKYPTVKVKKYDVASEHDVEIGEEGVL